MDKADSSYTGVKEDGAAEQQRQDTVDTSLDDDSAPADSGSAPAANQAKVSKRAKPEEPGHNIYHLPGPNYVGRSGQAEGKRWKQHERTHGRDVTGATNISAVTASTEKDREAYHIGAKNAYHNGDNGNRGAVKSRPHYYDGKNDKGVGGSYSTSTAQTKPKPK